MIRVVLASAAFIGVVLSLFLLQPNSAEQVVDHTAVEEDSVVARAKIELEAIETLATSMSLLSQTVQEHSAPELKMPPPKTTDYRMSDVTPATITSSFADEPTEVTAPTDGLNQLVASALDQGQSEEYIDALVNHAVSTGEVQAPTTLVTTDGRVDTVSLLSALKTDDTPALSLTDTYTIRPGDSLKTISYRYYGTTTLADVIFNANRDRLENPTQLSAGLQIVVPAM